MANLTWYVEGFWFYDLSSGKLFRILTFTEQNIMSKNDVKLKKVDGKWTMGDRMSFDLQGAVFRQ